MVCYLSINMSEYSLVELKNITSATNLREAIEKIDLINISNVARLQNLKAGLFMYLSNANGETGSVVLQNDDFRCLKQNGWTVIYYDENTSLVIYDLELACMSENKSTIRDFNLRKITDAKIQSSI